MRPGRVVDHLPPSSAEIEKKGRVVPLLPFRGLVTCYKVNIILTFYFMDIVVNTVTKLWDG